MPQEGLALSAAVHTVTASSSRSALRQHSARFSRHDCSAAASPASASPAAASGAPAAADGSPVSSATASSYASAAPPQSPAFASRRARLRSPGTAPASPERPSPKAAPPRRCMAAVPARSILPAAAAPSAGRRARVAAPEPPVRAKQAGANTNATTIAVALAHIVARCSVSRHARDDASRREVRVMRYPAFLTPPEKFAVSRSCLLTQKPVSTPTRLPRCARQAGAWPNRACLVRACLGSTSSALPSCGEAAMHATPRSAATRTKGRARTKPLRRRRGDDG